MRKEPYKMRIFSYIKRIIPIEIKDIIKAVQAYEAPIMEIKKSKEKIKKYKNLYSGKRCFVIGNGPSLTGQDLDKLCNEITFAANRIYYMFDKTKWRPNFYCVQDTAVAKDMDEDLLICSSAAEATFIRMKSYKGIKKIYNRIKNVILIPIYISTSVKNTQFSDKADKYIYDGWTVTYMSIQMAAYMGFSEIYLLGVDFNYPLLRDIKGNVYKIDRTIAAHFYETARDNKNRIDTMHTERNLAYYTIADQYGKNSGKFRIYNSTRGGKLEVFERVDFDSLF